MIGTAVMNTLEALMNPLTGRKYGEAAEGATGVPDVDPGIEASAAAATCGACFVCRVPEVRALWLLITMTVGCVRDEGRFKSRIEENCLDYGSWYKETCGPRTGVETLYSLDQWSRVYTQHREFSTSRVQKYAGQFAQLSSDLGGGANGYAAQRIANSWFFRDVRAGVPEGIDQAAPFYKAVCDQMRLEYPQGDVGPGHSNQSEGSMPYLVGAFLYESYATHYLNSTPHSTPH